MVTTYNTQQMSKIEPADGKLLDILNGFVRSKVLFSAFNLGLFSFIGTDKKTQQEIQVFLAMPERSARFLVYACQALGVLQSHSDLYYIAQDWLPILTSINVVDSKMHGLHQYMIGHQYQALYASMNHLEDILQENEQAKDNRIHWLEYAKDNPNERDINAYIPFMDSSVAMIAGALLETYSFENKRCVLDLFGSTGVAANCFAKRYPNLKTYFMDLPKVVEQSNIADELIGRVRPLGADIYQADFPDDIDVVTIIRSAHDHTTESLLQLFTKAFEKLPKGGNFVIAERMFPEDFTMESEDLYMRAITFLAMSENIDYRKASQYSALLKKVGFSRTEVHVPEAPYIYYRGMRVVVATK